MSAVALAVVASACSSPSAPSSSGTGEGGGPTSLILATSQELGGYNPVRGYGELGVSPLYDGLLRLKSTGDEAMPTLEPALAATEPKADAKLTTWRVPVKDGITFHDGSTLGPEDVVATFKTILDPASASDIALSLDMVSTVKAEGKDVPEAGPPTPPVPFRSQDTTMVRGKVGC